MTADRAGLGFLGLIFGGVTAAVVLVACTVSTTDLVIEVEDDGVGFRLDEMRQPRESGQGLGLLGMQERLALVGGTCTVESQPGQGTRVLVRLPLEPNRALRAEGA